MHMKVAAMRRMGLSSIELVPVKFTFLKRANRVRMRLHQHFTIEFGVILARLLVFRHVVTYSETSTLAERKMRFRSLVRSMHVYCDLVEHVPVGDTKSPLLRIVNRTSKGNENVHETFNPVLYVPLQKKCFDSVKINLMTDSGIPVPSMFGIGKSFVVLEFCRAAINISRCQTSIVICFSTRRQEAQTELLRCQSRSLRRILLSTERSRNTRVCR